MQHNSVLILRNTEKARSGQNILCEQQTSEMNSQQRNKIKKNKTQW